MILVVIILLIIAIILSGVLVGCAATKSIPAEISCRSGKRLKTGAAPSTSIELFWEGPTDSKIWYAKIHMSLNINSVQYPATLVDFGSTYPLQVYIPASNPPCSSPQKVCNSSGSSCDYYCQETLAKGSVMKIGGLTSVSLPANMVYNHVYSSNFRPNTGFSYRAPFLDMLYEVFGNGNKTMVLKPMGTTYLEFGLPSPPAKPLCATKFYTDINNHDGRSVKITSINGVVFNPPIWSTVDTGNLNFMSYDSGNTVLEAAIKKTPAKDMTIIFEGYSSYPKTWTNVLATTGHNWPIPPYDNYDPYSHTVLALGFIGCMNLFVDDDNQVLYWQTS